VFTESLLRNGLYNPVVPPLLCADDIENSLIYCCVLDSVYRLSPGNALIKSVTILWSTLPAEFYCPAAMVGSYTPDSWLLQFYHILF
jgi:hypothetical protein